MICKPDAEPQPTLTIHYRQGNLREVPYQYFMPSWDGYCSYCGEEVSVYDPYWCWVLSRVTLRMHLNCIDDWVTKLNNELLVSVSKDA